MQDHSGLELKGWDDGNVLIRYQTFEGILGLFFGFDSSWPGKSAGATCRAPTYVLYLAWFLEGCRPLGPREAMALPLPYCSIRRASAEHVRHAAETGNYSRVKRTHLAKSRTADGRKALVMEYK